MDSNHRGVQLLEEVQVRQCSHARLVEQLAGGLDGERRPGRRAGDGHLDKADGLPRRIRQKGCRSAGEVRADAETFLGRPRRRGSRRLAVPVNITPLSPYFHHLLALGTTINENVNGQKNSNVTAILSHLHKHI